MAAASALSSPMQTVSFKCCLQRKERCRRLVSSYWVGKVTEAISALLAYHKKAQLEKSALLDSSANLMLQLSLWELKANKTKTYSVNLPHSAFPTSGDAVLFVKDMPNTESDMCAHHYKEMLSDVDVPITVMPFKVLKTEYREFEGKRKLAKSYDIFLADDRIYHLLHQRLGKEFYRRKKYPATVNLKKKNLKEEIEKAIKATYFNLSHRGSSSSVTIGHTDMTEDQLSANAMAAIVAVAKIMPGGWRNIKSLHLRTDKSIALPIYLNEVHQKWEVAEEDKGKRLSNEDISKLKKQMKVEKQMSIDKKRKSKGLDPSEPLNKKTRRKRIQKLTANLKKKEANLL